MNLLTSLRQKLASLKLWVESFAEKPHALWALFLITFVESALIPIPPDVLLVTLGVASPRKAIRYGLICALGGFLGGYVGYFIGYAGFELIGRPVLSYMGMMENFISVLEQYRAHGILALTFAGFTPLPYVAFTLGAGFNATLSLTTLTIGSALGRLIRFGLVGVLLYFFGPPVKVFIDKYFERVILAITAVAILVFIILKVIL